MNYKKEGEEVLRQVLAAKADAERPRPVPEPRLIPSSHAALLASSLGLPYAESSAYDGAAQITEAIRALALQFLHRLDQG